MINFNRKKKRAFTLIEISIVLVIIGIILASVMKGRDLIKSSQIKEFNQVFVSQWETIANSYFSRMGAVLEDGAANGGDAASTVTNGFMDGEDISDPAKSLLVVTALQNAGIDPCDLIKTDITSTSDAGCDAGGLDVFKISIDGEFAGKVKTQIILAGLQIDGKDKNVIVFENVPSDVAQAIDTIKDGSPDGQKGSVLAIAYSTTTVTDLTTDATLVDWVDATAKTRNMVLILEH